MPGSAMATETACTCGGIANAFQNIESGKAALAASFPLLVFPKADVRCQMLDVSQ